jgi:hypothetical protein
VGNLASNTSHTFTGVSMPADGNPINLTATFSADNACTFTDNNAGMALDDCKENPPPIPSLSQWGLLIFALLIINLGVAFTYKLEVSTV